jgi:hypothetical protein
MALITPTPAMGIIKDIIATKDRKDIGIRVGHVGAITPIIITIKTTITIVPNPTEVVIGLVIMRIIKTVLTKAAGVTIIRNGAVADVATTITTVDI